MLPDGTNINRALEGEAGGVKNRGNPCVNGHNGQNGLVKVRWYGQLLRLRLRPLEPHRQHDNPHERGAHEPNIDPLIPRQLQYGIDPAHGSPF